jgi:CHAT domain-containing protein
MRAVLLVVIGGLLGAGAPGAVLAAPASSTPSLHERIIARYDGTIEADPVVEMRIDRALIAEAQASHDTNPEDIARLKMLLGLALTHAQRPIEAVREMDAGVLILEQAGEGNTALALEIMMNAAAFVGDAGDRDASAQRLKRVLDLTIAKFGPDSSEAGFTYGFIGYNALQQGRLADAIEAMQKGLARMRADPASKIAVAANYETYAHMLGTSGRTADYLAAARVAVHIAQTTLDPGQRGVGLTLVDLAIALHASGRYTEAEAIARQALAIDLKYRGRNNGDTAAALVRVAEAIAEQGHSVEAETLMLEAAGILVDLKSTAQPKEPARVLIRAAALARLRGDRTAARERLSRATAVLGEPTKGDELIRFLSAIEQARGLLVDKDYAKALSVIDAGLANARELAPTSTRRIEGEMLRALILARMERTAEAIEYATPVFAAMENHLLDTTVGAGEGMALAPVYAHAFSEFASIALTAGKTDKAFRAIQLANLSELAITYTAVAARAAVDDPALASLIRKLQDEAVQRDRLDHERSFALGRSAAEVTRLDAAIAQHDQLMTALSKTLDARVPQYRAIARPVPVALDRVVNSLPANTAVLAPILLDDSVVSVAITAKGLSWGSTAKSSATIASAVGAIRGAVEPGAEADGFPVGQAALLYAALLPDPIVSQIGRHADLLFFGGSVLSRIPLAVLVSGRPGRAIVKGSALRSVRWLVRDHSVETIGSFPGLVARLHAAPTNVAGASAGLGSERRSPTSAGFAGIGAPVLAAADVAQPAARARLRGAVGTLDLKTLPSLPGAATELRSLREKLHRPANLMLVGADASERRVRTSDLMPYGIIAFATHGVLAGEEGVSEPALVFTPPQQASEDDDGLLTASEASRLRLDADWVILSNCDSAGAGDQGAAPYSGLARAFFQAGARALLVSMWPVRDDAAARLTVATVDQRANLSHAHALRAAELATLADQSVRDGGHPAIWAPFVVIDR